MMSLRRIVMSSAVQSHHMWTKGFAKCVETSKAAPVKVKRPRKVYEKLKYLTVGTMDFLMREEKKKGISITHEDLLRWAKRLEFECRPEHALAVLDWMDRKKMVFSPDELAFYVELILKVRGYVAADAYFRKVDPEFDEMDRYAKNRPAQLVLDNYMMASWRNSNVRLL